MLKEKPNAEALPLESGAGVTLNGRYLASARGWRWEAMDTDHGSHSS